MDERRHGVCCRVLIIIYSMEYVQTISHQISRSKYTDRLRLLASDRMCWHEILISVVQFFSVMLAIGRYTCAGIIQRFEG